MRDDEDDVFGHRGTERRAAGEVRRDGEILDLAGTHHQVHVRGESGEAVVLVHGFGGNADHWRRTSNALSARGRRVFAIDLLGYGYSDSPIRCVQSWNRTRFIVSRRGGRRFVISWTTPRPAFVACNSVGGVAGLQAAVDAPEKIKGVVLMNVSLRGLHVTKQPPFARPFIKALQHA